MSIVVKLKANPIFWNSRLRIRAGQSVVLDGKYFQNRTGRNTHPETTNDWTFIGTVEFQTSGNLKIAAKLPGNTGSFIEVGDIVFGLLNNGTTFIPFGQYLGGDLQTESSYDCSPIEFSL